MSLRNSLCQCDYATASSFAKCETDDRAAMVKATANKKENGVKSVELQERPNTCVCEGQCHCELGSGGGVQSDNCGCGGMCGGNTAELEDYVIVVSRTCSKEKFLADRAVMGDPV